MKTGDIFYHETYTAHDNKTHKHKSRVLFVGTDNLFYDAWWHELNEWTFVPVKKNLVYYRFPLTQLKKLTFEGYEPIDKKSEEKLFLTSPEIILDINKTEFNSIVSNNSPIQTHSSRIAFLPMGPKGGILKPVYFGSEVLTTNTLIKKIRETQNIEFIPFDRVILHRSGLQGGCPSYCIKTN